MPAGASLVLQVNDHEKRSAGLVDHMLLAVDANLPLRCPAFEMRSLATTPGHQEMLNGDEILRKKFVLLNEILLKVQLRMATVTWWLRYWPLFAEDMLPVAVGRHSHSPAAAPPSIRHKDRRASSISI